MNGEKTLYFLELSHDRCLDNQTFTSFFEWKGTVYRSQISEESYSLLHNFITEFLTFMFMTRAKYAIFVIFNNFAHMCDPRYVV